VIRLPLVAAFLALALAVLNAVLARVHIVGFGRELGWQRREVPPPTTHEARLVLRVYDRLECGGLGRTRTGARLP
jgi:hypothetical protein